MEFRENAISENTIGEFLEELSSSQPTPGGGGAAAIVGAIGISLGSMVAELTIGKKKYAAAEGMMRALLDEAIDLRDRLAELADEDAEAFEPLAEAYADRDNADMEACLVGAAVPPLEIMRAAAKAIDLQMQFAEFGSKLAISDAACGAIICKAAMKAASLNVFVNTNLMEDRAVADEMNRVARKILNEYSGKADAVYETVMNQLTNE